MLMVALGVEADSLWRWAPEASVKKGTTRKLGLVGAMALTVALIAGVAYWDAERESAAALDDLAGEQATVARALATAFEAAGKGGGAPTDADVLSGLRAVERPRALAVFVHRPEERALRATSGRLVVSDTVVDAIARGASSVRIPREGAAAFGLPARTAFAGIAHLDRGRNGVRDIVVVASAEHERDRELGARRRLVLSVLTAAGLVLAFGGLAMRNQRKELVLERELAIAGVQQSRDERLERANKAAVMGTLAMGVAHEISTPLGVISARAEQMVTKVAGDERLSSSVAAILAQTDRIKLVIRGLLGLARGDAPSAERIDPRLVVEQAIGLCEHRFAKAGVRLRSEAGPGLPVVLGDPRLLEHAVVNLLLNACDASRPGDEVLVTARAEDAEVRLAVEDAGTGISGTDLGRAREPFFTTKARGEGTGLGLAIAHEIVASHRGTLEFASRAPRGTIAAIRLPPAERRSAEATSAEAKSPEAKSPEATSKDGRPDA
jgi:signal transduction histidine kinase